MFQIYFTNEKYYKKVKVYRCLECDIIAQEKSKKLNDKSNNNSNNNSNNTSNNAPIKKD